MYKNCRHIILLCCCIALSSCLTIVKGTKSRFTIRAMTNEPVTIKTTDSIYENVQLPAQIRVNGNHLNDTIELLSSHRRYAKLIPGKVFNKWAHLNAPFTGFVGYIVDAATGAMSRPAHTDYLITSCEKSDTMSLPLANYRLSSFYPYSQGNDYRHELRLQLGIGSMRHQPSYDRFCNSICHTQQLKLYDGFLCGLGGGLGISMSYFYHISNCWAVGLAGGYSFQPRESLSPVDEASLDFHHYPSIRCSYVYLMPTAKFRWLSFPHCSFYSRGAIGVICQHQHFKNTINPDGRDIRENGWHLGYQLSAFGFETAKSVRFFTEIGYGTEGVLNVGLSYYFGHR